MLLNRNLLGSIELSDVRDVELTENEIKERNASIAISFRYIEPAIKKLLIAQQEFMANQCENEQQLLFSRGSINGLTLALEEMKSYKEAHEDENKVPEKFNKFEIT
jgi:hypothetical protein